MQIKKEEVHNRILEHAKKKFLEHGYENVSIRTIAQWAGCIRKQTPNTMK